MTTPGGPQKPTYKELYERLNKKTSKVDSLSKEVDSLSKQIIQKTSEVENLRKQIIQLGKGQKTSEVENLRKQIIQLGKGQKTSEVENLRKQVIQLEKGQKTLGPKFWKTNEKKQIVVAVYFTIAVQVIVFITGIVQVFNPDRSWADWLITFVTLFGLLITMSLSWNLLTKEVKK